MARKTSALAVCGVIFAAIPAVPAMAEDVPAPAPSDSVTPAPSAPAPTIPAPPEMAPVAPKATPAPPLAAAPAEPDDASAAQKPTPEHPMLERKSAEHPPENKSRDTAVEGKPDESRYTFSRMQDGYLRLDNKTGQVSFCGKRTVGWTCQLAPDDRGVMENEIARVQEENAILKKELISRGLPLPSAVRADPPAAHGNQPFALPSDPNVERVKVFVEKVWRRLVEMISTLQKDVLKKS